MEGLGRAEVLAGRTVVTVETVVARGTVVTVETVVTGRTVVTVETRGAIVTVETVVAGRTVVTVETVVAVHGARCAATEATLTGGLRVAIATTLGADGLEVAATGVGGAGAVIGTTLLSTGAAVVGAVGARSAVIAVLPGLAGALAEGFALLGAPAVLGGAVGLEALGPLLRGGKTGGLGGLAAVRSGTSHGGTHFWAQYARMGQPCRLADGPTQRSINEPQRTRMHVHISAQWCGRYLALNAMGGIRRWMANWSPHPSCN